MSIKKLFVIVPSLIPTGPVKGAAALCNGLVGELPITLVVLKSHKQDGLYIDPRVEILDMGEISSWKQKVSYLKENIKEAGSRTEVASLSYCFSADALNFFMKSYAQIFTSVRGNLPMNYAYEYGPMGKALAWFHILSLHHFDKVVAMSSAMRDQLKSFGHKDIEVIGNFVDEIDLEKHRLREVQRTEKVRFIFLASLSNRKRPELLVQAAGGLQEQGLPFHVDIVGSGPLEEDLQKIIADHGLQQNVTLHGQLANPYKELQKADYLVIPSESEGIPRAGMEALFFGVPCILRDVDANRELVRPGFNGHLFKDDKDLGKAMAKAIAEVQQYREKDNLLPSQFRQRENTHTIFDITE